MLKSIELDEIETWCNVFIYSDVQAKSSCRKSFKYTVFQTLISFGFFRIWFSIFLEESSSFRFSFRSMFGQFNNLISIKFSMVDINLIVLHRFSKCNWVIQDFYMNLRLRLLIGYIWKRSWSILRWMNSEFWLLRITAD